MYGISHRAVGHQPYRGIGNAGAAGFRDFRQTVFYLISPFFVKIRNPVGINVPVFDRLNYPVAAFRQHYQIGLVGKHLFNLRFQIIYHVADIKIQRPFIVIFDKIVETESAYFNIPCHKTPYLLKKIVVMRFFEYSARILIKILTEIINVIFRRYKTAAVHAVVF